MKGRRFGSGRMGVGSLGLGGLRSGGEKVWDRLGRCLISTRLSVFDF